MLDEIGGRAPSSSQSMSSVSPCISLLFFLLDAEICKFLNIRVQPGCMSIIVIGASKLTPFREDITDRFSSVRGVECGV